MAVGTTGSNIVSDTSRTADGRLSFIRKQLNRARRKIRLIELSAAVIQLLAVWVGVLGVLVLADHWLWNLPVWFRWCVLVLLAGASLFWLVRRIGPYVVYPVHPLYAAKQLEEAKPWLMNSLVNFLLLRRTAERMPPAVMDAVEYAAAENLKRVPVDESIDRTSVIRCLLLLAAMVTLMALYQLVSPKSSWRSVERILMPWNRQARPSRVEILEIRPGDAQVPYGQQVRVEILARGMRPGEQAILYYSTADGSAQHAPLELNADDAGWYRAQLPPDEQGVRQDLRYYIRIGDAQTPMFRITVLQKPVISVTRIDYEYPPYMNRPPMRRAGTGAIEAPEGTRVTVHAAANLPVREAYIEWDPSSPAAEPRADLLMQSDALSARAAFVVKLSPDRSSPEHASYRVHYVASDGRTSSGGEVHPIVVYPDLAPIVHVLQPEKRRTEVPENSPVTIEVRALDPDFGLTYVAIQGTSQPEETWSEILLEDQAWHGQFLKKITVVPVERGWHEGQTIRFRAVARDNRHDSTGKPAPNETTSPEYELVILPPLRAAQTPSEKNQTGQSTDGARTQQHPQENQAPSPPPKPTPDSPGQPDSPSKPDSPEPSEPKQSDSESKPDSQPQATPQTQSDSSSKSPSRTETESKEGQSQESQSRISQDQGGQRKESPGEPSPSQQGQSPAEGRPDGSQAPSESKNAERTAKTGSAQQPPQSPAERSMPGRQEASPAAPANSANESSEPADRQPAASGTGEQTGDKQRASGPAREGSKDEPAQSGEPAGASGTSSNDAPGDGTGGRPPGDSPSMDRAAERSGGQKPQGKSPETPRDLHDGDVFDIVRRYLEEQKWRPADSTPAGSRDTTPPASTGQAGDAENQPQQPPVDQGGSGKAASTEGVPMDQTAGRAGDGRSEPDAGSRPELPDGDNSRSANQQSGGKGTGAGDAQNDEPQGGKAPANQSGSPMTDKSAETGGQQPAGGSPNAGTGAPGGRSEPNEGSSGGRSDRGTGRLGSGAPVDAGGLPPDVATAGSQPESHEVEPDLRYAEKATDLVLEYLRDQQQQPDPRLLERLGWTPEQLAEFVRRWEQLKRSAQDDPRRRGELLEALKSLGLRPPADQVRSDESRRDQRQQQAGSAERSVPPARYRELFNAFRKGTARAADVGTEGSP
ncbi:MAG: hypothetical protein KatS3mg110_1301 [Pirellulaceae bacterium]|nr:MAG: hypothetical protein KatS3mg110_1301 [Pirellulaceae bacterium]